MTILRGHFGGYVKSMDAKTASIEIDRVSEGFNVKKGDLVIAFRDSFMNQMPLPSIGSYAEGNVVKDDQGNLSFINIVRPV